MDGCEKMWVCVFGVRKGGNKSEFFDCFGSRCSQFDFCCCLLLLEWETNECNLKECTCEWIARATALSLLNSVIKFNYFGINLRNRASMREALAAVHTRERDNSMLNFLSFDRFSSLLVKISLHLFIKKYRVTAKKSQWMRVNFKMNEWMNEAVDNYWGKLSMKNLINWTLIWFNFIIISSINNSRNKISLALLFVPSHLKQKLFLSQKWKKLIFFSLTIFVWLLLLLPLQPTSQKCWKQFVHSKITNYALNNNSRGKKLKLNENHHELNFNNFIVALLTNYAWLWRHNHTGKSLLYLLRKKIIIAMEFLCSLSLLLTYGDYFKVFKLSSCVVVECGFSSPFREMKNLHW